MHVHLMKEMCGLLYGGTLIYVEMCGCLDGRALIYVDNLVYLFSNDMQNEQTICAK